MVKLVVSELLEIRLILDHLIEVGVVFRVSINNQQNGKENVEEERVDGIDQGLVVLPFYVNHISTYEEHWKQAKQSIEKCKFGRCA